MICATNSATKAAIPDGSVRQRIMRRNLLTTLALLVVASPLLALPQQNESLGAVARQLRTEKKTEPKPAAVFTNDNLPAPKPDEAISSVGLPPEPQSTPPAKSESKTEIAASKEEPASHPPETQEDKARTRDYWQERFKAARRDVAKAKEHEQLSEDELSLLQIRQVRELDPMAKDDLSAQVQAKQSEVDVNKVATDAAEKALDDLTKEFEASSAPEDWSKTD